VVNGGEKYAAIGVKKTPGTRCSDLRPHRQAGPVRRPTGYPLHKLIYEDAGGILGGKKLKAVIPGGSSTPILTAGRSRDV
jgi:NADH-quinone oxidoreductase subunit F